MEDGILIENQIEWNDGRKHHMAISGMRTPDIEDRMYRGFPHLYDLFLPSLLYTVD